jgi:hypothetical protein
MLAQLHGRKSRVPAHSISGKQGDLHASNYYVFCCRSAWRRCSDSCSGRHGAERDIAAGRAILWDLRQKLDAAAVVMQQMAEVRQNYQQKIDDAAPADKPRLESEGTAALEKVATDNGLSIDEYNSIATAVQNDPAVRAKLMQRVH